MSLPKLTPTYHKDTYPSISPTKPSLTQVGKTVLITGGGAGLGFEIARSFAKAGASRIIIICRRAGLLDEALNILVHVLILNAAHFYPNSLDTLSLNKEEIVEAFNINTLRPTGLKLHLINVSTAGVHLYPTGTQNVFTSKAAFTAMLGRIAEERSVDDVQILSFHPGLLRIASRLFCMGGLPRSILVAWRFVWAHWDVDELKADREVLKLLEEEKGYLKVGIQGLNTNMTVKSMVTKQRRGGTGDSAKIEVNCLDLREGIALDSM
ncbi:NAD(P)-binding protein [Gymnopus androsaceus JB14]|uniref:NAD(P)-binding protein n=1 Tax=Gymnopus androsaceus JB14 TaxID=1447944 RepID=A0A6A4HKF7_9AGAR|nr:NAD(P)-binding protein [Gymnopus androsaceus JB14]